MANTAVAKAGAQAVGAVLQNRPSNRDWLSSQDGEIRGPAHTSPVLLQKNQCLG